jgi:hypothetical protein
MMSLRAVGSSGQPLKTALVATLTVWTVSVVGLLAAGRLPLPDAIFLVGGPWAALAAALRPDWLILALVALPAGVTAVVQTSRILVLIVIALTGIVLTRSTFSLALGTGLTALMAIALAGLTLHADVAAAAQRVNQSLMLVIAYYVLLALLAFNLAILGELSAQHLGTAFVVGVATTLVLGLAGYGNAWFPSGTEIVSRTYLGYLAAGGLGVGLAWLLATDAGRRPVVSLFVTAGLLCLTVASFGRAVWIAGAATFVVLAFRSGRRRYVLIAFLAVGLSLVLPAARQELASTETGDIAAAFRTGEISTGRWELWMELWDRAEPALPWGNGFGYTWSLTSEELFGSEGVFSAGESASVHPHSDFVFLLVEFGFVGLFLIVWFWMDLFRAHFLVTRSSDRLLRFDGQVLLGILLTGLVMALVDNLFGIRPFAERFFPAAGVMLALARIERARHKQVSPLSARDGTSPTSQ